MPPKVIARNADRHGGVLPVSTGSRATSTKQSSIRLKLEVRRLPPGLTLTEFEEALGDEWKLNNGRVDWREYRQGKTRTPGSGKVPEQSRCYIHVVNEACVRDFEKRFLEVVFHDKAGTHKNPDLKHLAPTLGFAPNQRTPLQQTKQRTDNRQGTIDQDAEFIAFLEAETQPITKPPALDAAAGDRDGEKIVIKTTPLIEDLRERKANKAKAAQAKTEKVDKEKKSLKSPSKDAVPTTQKDGSKTIQQVKVEQAAKEAVKAANKQAVSKQAQQAKTQTPTKTKKPQPSPKPQNAVPVPPTAASGAPTLAPQRGPSGQRQRGNADNIKKMLQKDLGIRPKAVPAAEAASTVNTSTTASISPLPTTSRTAQTASVRPSTASISTPKSASASTPTAEPKAPAPKAYLKHANPSQGMTEMLIQQALAQYGEMVSVTIDPRKGTAIAWFKQKEGLEKALEAKRVPVANGAVEVLEFRDRTAGGPPNRGGYRGGRGGRGGARGGGGVQNNATANPVTAGSAPGP